MLGSWEWSVTVLAGLAFTSRSALGDSNNILPDDPLDGPIIEPSENEIILQNGQNYTLKCKGKIPIDFKQQEVPEVVVGPFTIQQRIVPTNDGYEIALDLFHVDKFAVGYYACFDNSINNIDNVLNNISEEPKNTAHISYIYIYVNGSDSLMAPMREIVIPKSNTKILIECKPTAPDINVTLISDFEDQLAIRNKYNPKFGFIFEHDLLSGSKTVTVLTCGFVRRDHSEFKDIFVNPYVATPPVPVISDGYEYFLEGETFTLNCSVPYQTNHAVYLEWKIPRQLDYSSTKDEHNILKEGNDQSVTDGRQFTVIHVVNATKKDAGNYTCVSRSGGKGSPKTVEKIFLSKPFIKLRRSIRNPIETFQKKINLQTTVDSYPEVEIIMEKDGKIITDSSKYVIKYNRDTGSAVFTINNVTINDTGNYTLVARNKYMTQNITYEVKPLAASTVEFGSTVDKKFVRGQTAHLTCSALGNPLPQLNWHLESSNNEVTEAGDSKPLSSFKMISYFALPVHLSLNVTCIASNKYGNTSMTKRLLVYDIEGGFGILNKESTWYWENQNVTLDCVGSIYDYNNVTWVGHTATYSRSLYSHHAKLNIENLGLENSGTYTCLGITKNLTTKTESINITVEAMKEPDVIEPAGDQNMEVFPFQPVTLFCLASAVPPPSILWFKDGQTVYNSSNIQLKLNILNKTTVNSSIEIKQAMEEDKGKYECVIKSGYEETNRFYNIMLKGKTPPLIYLSIIGVILLLLLVVVVFLAWKIRKEKQFKKMLEAAGLLHFKEGVAKSLNPDLGIDEQAELLPYDEKFEFPAEKIKLGKQLGAGAFGVVYKAEVRGIINAEETTTVAVKMVKKTADNMFIKALASELKIMVHLGKHVNIVNLLGACTKNVGKRELVVIVEYCKFGNIHNYMQKHREVFIDQLTDKSTSRINRGFSSSSGNSGMHSDYFSSNQTQETDHTFLSNRSGRKDAQSPNKMESEKESENGYVPPQWGSAYETDYSFDGHSPRPLSSRDLLAWAFQIARGMEYLASRKVLHGDLAARNILLADDNIVKICDFGLARSIYKNEEYQKTENSPLPVKWLAIECMVDRIFSTQSDVWSFGIVLWEMFSLAKTPYPNISHTSLLQFLSEGHRLEKPSYADDRIYDVMKKCWIEKPTLRPTFTQLQETLGTFLEDNVRNNYVDLNSAYMDSNVKKEGVEDYLDMVCAPDYNNLVTPSPHHYVNDANKMFFANTPAPLMHDDEGYLQMSPASALFCPRAQDNKFNFDARKLNPSGLEVGSLGSERTPMLTLNNLPARSGSESDHEGNSSPYLNMCTRIDEEADNVFETKQNNIKNMYNGVSISNPTYTTCDIQQNKTNDIKNLYENTNGLVNK